MKADLLRSRSANFLKITSSYLLSRLTGKMIFWGYPVAVGLETNNTCNLSCPECPAGVKELTRPRGYMSLPFFRNIIGQLSPELAYITLYFQGEPYLNPEFFDFIQFARSKGIFVSSSTNGHFLTPENARKTVNSGLNRLIISLDGAEQESYSVYRTGGDLNKVTEGIRVLVRERRGPARRNPEIILQCLILRSNEHQMNEIRRQGRELGVDKVIFKTAQFNDFKNGNPLMPENTKFSRYARADIPVKPTKSLASGTADPETLTNTESSSYQNSGLSTHYVLKNRQPDHCFRMWSGCVITWDGKVVPCCFDKDAEHSLGDLNRDPFRKIWEGKIYNDFRKTIMTGRKSVDICRNCTQTF